MPYQRFKTEDVGVCLSILMADPRIIESEEVEQIVAACHRAGFSTLSLSPPTIRAVGIPQLQALLQQHGMKVRTIEGIVGWTNGADAATEDTEASLELASALGADMLLAATIAPVIDSDLALQGMIAACKAAAVKNVRIAIEFIPGTAVPDMATAWQLARASGADNVGVVLDILHWYHQPGGPDFATLKSIPPECILYVQACDSPPGLTPSAEEYIPFAMTARELPGNGIVDIETVLATLDGMGVDPYIAVESFNTQLAMNGPENLASALRASIDRMLA